MIAAKIEKWNKNFTDGLGPIVSKLLYEYQGRDNHTNMDTRRVVNALNNMTDSKGLPAQHPVGLYKPLIDKFVWCFNQDAAQEYSEG